MNETSKQTWQVSSTKFVAGLVVANNLVVEAAPILSWTLGKRWSDLRNTLSKRYHFKIELVIRLLPFLLCATAIGQPSPPRNLRVETEIFPLVVSTGTNNPFHNNHVGLVAYWQPPTTNLWVPEWSTNGIDWQYCGNETVYVPSYWHFTETGTNWSTNWQVRIRKLQ